MKDKSIIFDIRRNKEDVMFYVYDLLEYAFSLTTCCISDTKEFKDLDLAKVFTAVDKALQKTTGVDKPKPDDVGTRIDQFVDTANRDPRLQDILKDGEQDEISILLKLLVEGDE